MPKKSNIYTPSLFDFLEKEETIEEKAKELIQLALEHGGNDNVAVVLWEK